jgi:RNA polymerase sigma-70 factor (ECF subfamily)
MDRYEILIKGYQSGDKEAFDKLVLENMKKVFNLCYRFVGNYEEANDCAQETFIKVYRSLGKFRFQSAFSTWLYRIAVNTCKNHLKSARYRNLRKTVSINGSMNSNEGETYKIEIEDDTLSPSDVLDRKEKSEQIQSAIDSLSKEHKEVVVLCDVEGLSYEKIAEITGEKLGTIKSKLARAREKLREELKGII